MSLCNSNTESASFRCQTKYIGNIKRALCITNSSFFAGCAKKYDVKFQRKRTSCVPRNKYVGLRNFQKQRRWTVVLSLLRRFSNELMFRTFTTVIQLSMYGKFRIILSPFRGNLQQSIIRRQMIASTVCQSQQKTLPISDLVRVNLLQDYRS